MSHEQVWKGSGDPYGRPGDKGNYDEIWGKLTKLPCPECGAKTKSMTTLSKREVLITCGPANR